MVWRTLSKQVLQHCCLMLISAVVWYPFFILSYPLLHVDFTHSNIAYHFLSLGVLGAGVRCLLGFSWWISMRKFWGYLLFPLPFQLSLKWNLSKSLSPQWCCISPYVSWCPGMYPWFLDLPLLCCFDSFSVKRKCIGCPRRLGETVGKLSALSTLWWFHCTRQVLCAVRMILAWLESSPDAGEGILWVSSSQPQNSAWAGTRVNSAAEEALDGLHILSEY